MVPQENSWWRSPKPGAKASARWASPPRVSMMWWTHCAASKRSRSSGRRGSWVVGAPAGPVGKAIEETFWHSSCLHRFPRDQRRLRPGGSGAGRETAAAGSERGDESSNRRAPRSRNPPPCIWPCAISWTNTRPRPSPSIAWAVSTTATWRLYPCLGHFQLNNDGWVGACEADLQSTLTMLLMTYLVRRPGYISDPVIDTATNRVVYLHCCRPDQSVRTRRTSQSLPHPLACGRPERRIHPGSPAPWSPDHHDADRARSARNHFPPGQDRGQRGRSEAAAPSWRQR